MKIIWILCFAVFVSTAQLSGQDTYQSLLEVGKSQLQAGNSDQALATATKAIRIGSDRWEAYAVAGGALMNLKRYEDADDRFGKAIDLAPDIKKPTLRNLRKQCVLAESRSPQLAVAAPTNIVTTQEEVVRWKSIEKQNDAESLRAYLAQYPNGAFAPLARAQLDRIDQETEKAAQANAETTKDPAVLRAYLAKYPQGSYASDAKVRLPQLHSGVTLHVYCLRDKQQHLRETPHLVVDGISLSPLALGQSLALTVAPGKHILSLVSLDGKGVGKPFNDLNTEPGGEYWVSAESSAGSTGIKWKVADPDQGKKDVNSVVELSIVK